MKISKLEIKKTPEGFVCEWQALREKQEFSGCVKMVARPESQTILVGEIKITGENPGYDRYDRWDKSEFLGYVSGGTWSFLRYVLLDGRTGAIQLLDPSIDTSVDFKVGGIIYARERAVKEAAATAAMAVLDSKIEAISKSLDFAIRVNEVTGERFYISPVKGGVVAVTYHYNHNANGRIVKIRSLADLAKFLAEYPTGKAIKAFAQIFD